MIGILTFAYGAPAASMDDLEAYYMHIHKKKAQSAEKIEQMKDQFRQIAVGDTLGSITKRQIKALETTLQCYFQEPVKGYAAYKHTSPFVEDVVEQMINDGVTKMITIPIKPLYSKSGYVYYQVLVRQALNIERWHDHPSLVNVLSNRVRTAWDWLPRDMKDDATVIFTSHSLPGRPETHHAFENQFTELAGLIANQANTPQWRISYRSGGTSQSEMWLGPDIKEVIEQEAQRGCKGIIICELLSLTSNVEAAFDVGYDIQPICHEKGMEFFKTAMVDDSFDFIIALTKIIQDKVAESDFLEHPTP
ncbi:ferrochelatase [Oceanobacillus jeddahense]|uniref:Ferrochelatase n=1 Tax=Oceanobacillus jeddahense TaxID=1462527 RepID=A0ABY5JPR6_9BACI|nr:ferrochelatase [Oceanobacillus jeddahense]UUI01076.1 ferrochelatase [Oceanobacillus jeddahense]